MRGFKDACSDEARESSWRRGGSAALKPHLLVPALPVEGYLALAARDRRPWRRAEAIAPASRFAYGLVSYSGAGVL
jgi:hypothetical protein